jgi:hypothetical protein
MLDRKSIRLFFAFAVVPFAACGDDEFPWPDELSTAAAAGASSWALYDIVRIETAVAESDPLAAIPEGCGALSGVLTSGGDPKDSDADGIPDDVTYTFTRATCDKVAFPSVGHIRVKDAGVTRGYDYNADLVDTIIAPDRTLRRTDVRSVRWNGTTTTGSIKYREWLTQAGDFGGTEESGYSATFTLTPTTADTLAVGAFGPSTLELTGGIDRKDDLGAVAGPWRFSIRSESPITLDPACGDYGSVSGGALSGGLNGGTSVTFAQVWTSCGVSTISTEGTTD